MRNKADDVKRQRAYTIGDGWRRSPKFAARTEGRPSIASCCGCTYVGLGARVGTLQARVPQMPRPQKRVWDTGVAVTPVLCRCCLQAGPHRHLLSRAGASAETTRQMRDRRASSDVVDAAAEGRPNIR